MKKDADYCKLLLLILSKQLTEHNDIELFSNKRHFLFFLRSFDFCVQHISQKVLKLEI